MQFTVTLDTKQVTALTGALARENAAIEAENANIAAQKARAEAEGRTGVIFPDPKPLRTLEDIVQDRINDRISLDILNRTREMAGEIAQTYLTATPERQAEMLAAFESFKQPQTPPAQRPRKRGRKKA